MTYHYDDNVAQFEKDVQLAHRTGSKMKLARSILGETAMEAEARAGQEASVRADALVVRFLRPERDTEAGAGRLSGNEVDAFNASGSVYFDEGGVSAIAEQITYNRQDDLLQIIGRDDAPAQLFDQRKRFSTLSGPKIYWDRRSNQIKMPKPRGNVR